MKQDNDVIYTADPKEMRFIEFGTTLEELHDIVYEVMNISRHHWNLKLSFKYPRLGVGNLVTGYFVKSIRSDDDVRRMLSIPGRFLYGMGDVWMFVEAESVAQQSQPYEAPWTQQSGQSHTFLDSQQYDGNYAGNCGGGYGGDYGGSELGSMAGWSNSVFQSGYNYGTVGHTEVAEEDIQLSQPRQTRDRSAAVNLALHGDEEDEENATERALTTSDDLDWNLSDEEVEEESEDFSEADSDEVREGNTSLQTRDMSVYVPRAAWFGSQQYETEIVSNVDTIMSHGFNPSVDELGVGAMFRNKEVLISAVKEAHIKMNRNFVVQKSTTQKYKVKCTVYDCKWKLRAAKKKQHGMFEITECPETHTCLLDRPTQDHKKISAKMIGSLVAPHVSRTTYCLLLTLIFCPFDC